RGRTHKDNEDRYFVDTAQGLYLISDGMAESISPQIVVDTLPDLLRQRLAGVAELTDPTALEGVGEAIAEVSQAVYKESTRRRGMLGATVVLALVHNGRALVAHLGDSRAYLRRAGRLERLTRDHSQVQRMIDLGWIKPEEASWRGNGGPTRYAGMKAAAEADLRCLELQSGDRLLLCSDGLTEMLTDEEILPLLDPALTPEQNCKRLVDAANQAGGKDNVTVIVIAVT
ncbi:MAG TPA: protein phosphatase 2C domain-containing protein, partial [Gemmataceae bacterium]|nr:protein phosphatase 2C domain-containing protein [Gemmataceae bacterium]